MRHFIGGAALGLLVALVSIQRPKPCPEMSNLEFAAYLIAHALCSVLVGLIAWGLLP